MNNTENNPILVDDEPQSRKILQSFLQDYCPHVDIIGEADPLIIC